MWGERYGFSGRYISWMRRIRQENTSLIITEGSKKPEVGFGGNVWLKM